MDSKNFGLTEEEFDKLCTELKNDNEVLFEKIFLSHFDDCIGFLKSKFKISHEEAYDASMDTMLEFRRYLLTDKIKYGNLRFLITKMAGQRWMKQKKRNSAVSTTDELPEVLDLTQMHSDEELEVLDRAWATLAQECQKLLKQFYYNKLQLSVIAENTGKTPGSIRKQKERCVNNLRSSFQQYL